MNISRKNFIRIILGFLSLPLIYLINKLLNIESLSKSQSENRKVEIPANIPTGITFYDTVIASNFDGNLKFFSSKCPHLGCKIDRMYHNELYCPCHGSKFSRDGIVKSGPAKRNLNILKYTADFKENKIIVTVDEG